MKKFLPLGLLIGAVSFAQLSSPPSQPAAQIQIRNGNGAWTDVGYAAGNSTVPVTGTFYPSIQSVAAASTFPVSGTFWQPTQPTNMVANTRVKSTINSSTTNLTPGSPEFFGVGEDVLGFNTVDVSLYADQGILVDVLQSDDNVNWDLDDPLIFNTGVADSQAIRIVKRYVKITAILNAFTGPTTFFRLSVIYSPDSVGLPRSLWSQTGLPVSGNFWQATQPVSLAKTINVGAASTFPVSGTFWQATQPVSLAVAEAVTQSGTWSMGLTTSSSVIGHVIVDTAPSTQVTGTFYPTVQAVSAASTFPVSGTFYPTVQAVSAASTFPVSGTFYPTVQAVSAASTFPVSGTFWQATQPVSLAAAESVTQSGTWNVGLLTSASTIGAVNQSGTWTVQPGNTANTVPWLTSLYDSANRARVEPPNTAAVAGDSSFVVSQNPTGGNPCINPTATLASANGVTSGTAAVQIIPLSGTTKIYVCSLSVFGNSGTIPTFSLVQGTGSSCATGRTNLTQPQFTGPSTFYPFASPVAVTAAGNAVCYLDGGTNPSQNYQMSYIQQ